MTELRVPSDVVKTVFHFLGEGKDTLFRFPADVPRIHEAFFQISKQEKFKRLFRDFIFDTSQSFPYCPTIRFALDRLQKANLLSCINPSLDMYEISQVLAKLDMKQASLFEEEELIKLREAAEEFEKFMSTSA